MADVGLTEQILRLLLAAGVGMVIGLEREWREKAAGFRTMALVSLGSAAFMMAATAAVPDSGARIVAGVTAGVGFLGAGAILRDRGQVLGLTTAAAVWLAAALGVMSAIGEYWLTVALMSLGLTVLLVSPLIDLTRMRRDSHVYDVHYRFDVWDQLKLQSPFTDAGLHAELVKVASDGAGMTVAWRALGRPEAHRAVLDALVCSEDVESFTVE